MNLPDELFTSLLDHAAVRIERIVSHGHRSPEGFWYDQNQHEWVIVLTGAATLRLEDETVEMKPGDYINIPAHKRHRVEWTAPGEPTVWLAVHYEETNHADYATMPSGPIMGQHEHGGEGPKHDGANATKLPGR